jgi:hypothetical protein
MKIHVNNSKAANLSPYPKAAVVHLAKFYDVMVCCDAWSVSLVIQHDDIFKVFHAGGFLVTEQDEKELRETKAICDRIATCLNACQEIDGETLKTCKEIGDAIKPWTVKWVKSQGGPIQGCSLELAERITEELALDIRREANENYYRDSEPTPGIHDTDAGQP